MKKTAKDSPQDLETDDDRPIEIGIVGDLCDSEKEITQALLEVPIGGQCTIFFNCPGGSAYSAISLLTIIMQRQIEATGIVSGECSSAALWPFAACKKRFVTPFSFLLFHPMKWQSEESIRLVEAAEWTRHFKQLETEMDRLLANFLGISTEKLREWTHPGKYISGMDLVSEGLAELIELAPVPN